MVELYVNSGDSVQMSHFAMSDLGLHCLPITLLGDPVYNGLIAWGHTGCLFLFTNHIEGKKCFAKEAIYLLPLQNGYFPC